MDALDEKWTQCLVGTSSGKFNTELNPYTTDKPADTWHALVGSDNRPMCIPDVLRIDAGAVREENTFRQFHPWLHLRQRQVCICLDSQQHHHLDPCAILWVRERTQLLLPPAATGTNCGRGRQGKFWPQAFEAEKDVEQNSHAMLETLMATGL